MNKKTNIFIKNLALALLILSSGLFSIYAVSLQPHLDDPLSIPSEIQDILLSDETGRVRIIAKFKDHLSDTTIANLRYKFTTQYSSRFTELTDKTFAIVLSTNALKVLLELDLIKNLELDREISVDKSTKDLFAPITTEIPGRESAETLLNLTALLDKKYNGTNIVVAILDSGIDSAHPDLNDFDDNESTSDSKVIAQASFVEGDTTTLDLSGHGTYCAGVVGGTGNASSGLYTGIAPGVQFISAKVQLAGLAYASWIVSGIEWSVDMGADIILIPFVAFGFPGDALDQALQRAVELGVFVVSVAGDNGPNYMTILGPGGSPYVFTIGGYDSYNQEVPHFSGRGSSFDLIPKPDFIAPAMNIIGPKPSSSSIAGIGIDFGDLNLNDLSGFLSGDGAGGFDLSDILGETNFTSVSDYYQVTNSTVAAASIFTGALAILLQYNHQISPMETHILLSNSATRIGAGVNVEGNGLPNFGKIILELAENPMPHRPRTTGFALPYLGFVISQSEESSTILMESLYATSTLILMNNSRLNLTSLHMLMGSFLLSYNNQTQIPFYSMQIVRELHYTTLPIGAYTRTAGVLGIDDLLIVPTIETWQLGTTLDPVFGYKITIAFLNIGPHPITNISLFSSWQPDLFLSEENSNEDDRGQYNATTQTLYCYDTSIIDDTSTTMFIGYNSSMSLSGYSVGDRDDVSSDLANDNLHNETNYFGDVALASQWNFPDLEPHGTHNISMVLAIANSNTRLQNSIASIWEQIPASEAADLVLVNLDQPRIASRTNYYESSIMVINIGNNASGTDTTVAFIVNETLPQGGGIFTTYYLVNSISVYNFTRVESVWLPEHSSVYAIGWIVASSLDQLLQTVAGSLPIVSTELYLLDNFFLRDTFIWNPTPRFSGSPNSLPYSPYEIHFPGNFGIYSLVLRSTVPLSNLSITLNGNASEWIQIDESIPSLSVLSTLQIIIFSEPIIPAGVYVADINITASEGYSTWIHFETIITYPRSTILFDTIHNQGLDLSEGLDVSNLDEIISIFSEMGDSLYTGYFELYQQALDANVNLMEIPQLESFNASLLQNFDGIFIPDPEKELTVNETQILDDFMKDGGKVIIVLNSLDDSNLSSYNKFLYPYGIQAYGNVPSSTTIEINSSSDVAVNIYSGISSLTFPNGVGLLTTETSAESLAQINSTNIGMYMEQSIKGGLLVLSSADNLLDKNIHNQNNLHLAQNLIQYLYKDSLTLSASVKGNSSAIFSSGERVYLELNAQDLLGNPVDNLTVYVIFILPDGEQKFFFAASGDNGLYTSLFLGGWWNSTGYIDVIFLIRSSERYTGSFVNTRFYYEASSSSPPPLPEPIFELIILIISMIITAIATLTIIAGYLYRRYNPIQRMHIPELKKDFIMEASNLLNVFGIHFKTLLSIIEDPENEALNKIVETYTILEQLEKQMKTLKKYARDVGGK